MFANAGAASERMNVDAEPLTTVPLIVALGLAPTAGAAPLDAAVNLP